MKLSWKVLLIYTFFVIVWGAFVRASGSGDGCGAHWPSCEGDFLLQAPDSKKLIEYIHRATSGLYGIFVLILSIWTMLSKKYSKIPKLFAAGVLFFTIAESLIGAQLVLSELVGSNTSFARAVVMMIHLTNTLILVACNAGVIYFLDVRNDFTFSDNLKKTLKYYVPIFSLFFLTGASGALAALGDTLYPSENLLAGFAMDIDPGSPLIIKLRSFHPLFAFSLVGMILWFIDPKKYMGTVLMGLALTTLVIGLINLVLLAPIYMQLLHLSMVLCFWVTSLMYFFEEASLKKT